MLALKEKPVRDAPGAMRAAALLAVQRIPQPSDEEPWVTVAVQPAGEVMVKGVEAR